MSIVRVQGKLLTNGELLNKIVGQTDSCNLICEEERETNVLKMTIFCYESSC